VLDLTCGGVRARDALAQLRGWAVGPIAVRIARPTDVAWSDLDGVDVVLLGPDVSLQRGQLAASTLVLMEVTDPAQARHACDLSADGLLVRGNEAGGQVGELSTFVLVQHVLADPRCARLPLYAWGGIGPHTAAAVIAAGAAGVVLDVQLALLAESAIGGRTAKVLGAQDGTRTAVVAGHRVLAAGSRRGVPEDITEEEMAHLLPGGDLAGNLAGDLAGGLLPVGQDAYLAAQFAQQYGDVATAVRAVTASARRPLPGPADDGFLGTRLPVAQVR
jgi:NAD(P)H-dependent flavin oxidoreductase YrpB (nitropropane dioxygenase family)